MITVEFKNGMELNRIGARFIKGIENQSSFFLFSILNNNI